MSLLDQSQQWFPTSVQVTVHQARNLRVKGKDGTNDAYAIIQVAKDKFSTSVAEKCVAPVWKEEAAFDLPLFHPGNAERCTLYIIVMHRAQMGLDKFLGQAVINLLELHDNKSRKKTEWFKLVDKSGKEDKVRGEVLLDIQFMRNNMSASMFDLSMQDKPRSRISKIKDKVRGKKKKDGFSDSVSAIVPSVSQVLTDSEEEADAQSLNQAPGATKKSKLKSLFAPKTNLQRNISQSMSTLGTLPEKNSSLSGSRSSGINTDSPEVKKKFKFLGHKRTGSSDSKVSLGAFSLLGRSKQSNSDLNNLCINGSHVYTEQAESKNGSTLSLNSSGQGSMEDVRKHTSDADPIKGVPVTCNRPESTFNQLSLEQQRHQEEEKRRRAEEKRIAEARRLEEEERYKAEAKRLQEEEQRKQQEEQERRRRFVEDEARKEKQKEEERRRQEEEYRMQEAAENQTLEEERRRADEQKHQEEASMSERLSSLFGMIRKKDEKKEEVQQHAREEQLPTPVSELRGPDQTAFHRSTNPFEDVSLSSDPPHVSSESPADNQKFSPFNPQTPSATFFLNRTAKVSAVKPRLAQTLESEPAECKTPCQRFPSPAKSESTLASLPSESPDTFSNLHSSLAPPKIRRTQSGSSCGSTENLSSVGSGESSPTMANQKRRAPLPPSYPEPETPNEGNQVPVGDLRSPADGTQQGNKLSIPLPDYETLFPLKRHGVQGHSRWDHIIAEVNQRHRDTGTELLGAEMSVDGPDEHELSPGSSILQENPLMRKEETKLESSKKVAVLPPPKPVASAAPQSVAGSSQKQDQNIASHSLMRPNPFTVNPSLKSDHSTSSHGNVKVLHPAPAATSASTATSQIAFDTAPLDDQRTVQGTSNKEAPTAKPRQRYSGKEQPQRDVSAVNSTIQTPSNVNGLDKMVNENFGEFDPFPSSQMLSSSPWEQLKQNQEVKSIFTGNVQKERRPEDDGMTTDDLDKIFNQEKVTDSFASLNDSNKQSGYKKKDDSEQISPAFLRRNSQRGKKILPSTVASDNKIFMSQQEPVYKEGTSLSTANHVATNAPVAPQPQADGKTQNSCHAGDDPFGVDPFRVPSTLTSVESLPVVMEEPASRAENLSGGKTLLRAWVSPSEGQPVSSQNSNGSGLASTPRRPHPVKPMSATEGPHPTNTPAVKEIKVRDITSGMTKHVDSMASGPYSQLTQEELITLVVKQQADLSRKDAKIVELEDYIDNLLVRVIDEKPTILQSLTFAKPV